MSITVLRPGLQTTIQSRPRTGLRHFGVPSSGAADPLSLALANRLVANAWHAPALEAALLGPTLRFDVPCAFAITGATAMSTLNGDAVGMHETVFAEAGDVLAIGAAETGARSYLAVAGGLAAEAILGSVSTYLPAALGGYRGRAVEEGDRLGIVQAGAKRLSTPAEFRVPMTSSWAVRACASFEFDVLDKAGRDRLFDSKWTIGRRADRMGLRLEGQVLDVASDGRMPSAAVFPGTVQCPESGLPFVLAVDAGTVGGYPRVAQVTRADCHLLGQLRPGSRLRLLLRDPESAGVELRAKHDYWREWLRDIDEII